MLKVGGSKRPQAKVDGVRCVQRYTLTYVHNNYKSTFVLGFPKSQNQNVTELMHDLKIASSYVLFKHKGFIAKLGRYLTGHLVIKRSMQLLLKIVDGWGVPSNVRITKQKSNLTTRVSAALEWFANSTVDL